MNQQAIDYAAWAILCEMPLSAKADFPAMLELAKTRYPTDACEAIAKQALTYLREFEEDFNVEFT